MKLSYSSIRNFLTCRKKYYYNNVLGIESKDIPIYFDEGRAFHKGMQAYYNKGYRAAIKAVNDYYIKRYNKSTVDPEIKESKIEEIKESRLLVLKLMKQYYQKYKLNDINVQDTEIEFNIDIAKGINFHGFVDATIKEDGLMWIVEHKTASNIDSKYKAKLLLDNQCLSYIWALRKNGVDIKGVLYNVAVKKLLSKPILLKSGKLSQDKNKSPDRYEYIKAIHDNGLKVEDYQDYLDHLETNQKLYHYREWLSFPKETLKEFENELVNIAADINICHKNNSWYKNTNNCIVFGTCPFFEICTAIFPESVIEISYKQKDLDLK